MRLRFLYVEFVPLARSVHSKKTRTRERLRRDTRCKQVSDLRVT
jgi:hypothetical protein